MATKKRYTNRDLAEHLLVLADLAEEVGDVNLARLLRMLRPGESAVDFARGILRRDHYDDIESDAKSIVDEIPGRGYRAEEARVEEIESRAEGYTTYFSNAWQVAFASDNTNAIEELGEIDDVNQVITQIAYMAVRQDLSDAVQRELDNRPDEEEEAEEEEDEEDGM